MGHPRTFFCFVLKIKIPTSRAQTAREMGHPNGHLDKLRFGFSRLGFETDFAFPSGPVIQSDDSINFAGIEVEAAPRPVLGLMD
jgi:hypothetical protein